MNAITQSLIAKILTQGNSEVPDVQAALILAGIVTGDLSPAPIQKAVRSITQIASTSENPEVWCAYLLADIAANGGFNGGVGGATTFITLTDVPQSYVGQAGKVPVVNGTESGLEFTNLTGGGDMLKAIYNPQDDGKIHFAQMADVGSMAQQSADSVAITGGDITGITTVAGVTGAFESLAVGTDGVFIQSPDAGVGVGLILTATGTGAVNLTADANGVILTKDGNGSALTGLTLGQLATFDSATLRGRLTDETGTGAAVFATSPTLVTPILGTPQSGDFSTGTFTWPTFNQNTTGSAATLTTPRSIYGNNFNGSADLTQIIASTYGGTGNGFTKFTGPTTSEKTFTLPNSNAAILTDAAVVTLAQGGTGATTAKGAVTNLCTVVDNANTTITLTASDSGTILRCTAATAVTVNLPASDLGAGFNLLIIQAGAGQVTVAANGNTLNSANSYTKIGVQHGSASLIRTAASTYNLSGYLAA